MSQPTQQDIAEGILSKLFSPELCKIDSCKTGKINKLQCPTGKEKKTITDMSIFQLKAISTRADEIICPFTKEQLIQEQKADRVLSQVHIWMTNGVPETDFLHDLELKYVASLFKNIFIDTGIIILN